ncbi:MAG TPA: tripartite tricarboxylate transporter substrate binding protein [Burkholderiales bacterium]|jgi:tripartite-type tricarboxylate transporter receptor subunit TctC|nr:tripartite tricarboxylate transporter substrate binding protein [Burkholderiales bacterium]
MKRYAGLLLFVFFSGAALAQYPAKPIRMVVGFAPGGGTDLVARIIGQKMTESWGQPVLVDNRAGATGTIGADIVAKAPPDGYALLMGHVNSHGIAPNLFKKLPYDAERDFAMVAYVGYVPNVLVVHPSIPARNVKELIAIAKAQPGTLNYASSGVGSTQHLAGELFTLLTGVKIVHVPYKGSGPAVIDLLAGHVSMNFDTMPPVLPHIKSGRLRALGLTTPKRSPQLPNVPTMIEVGLKGFDMTNWYGIMAPAKTPRDIVMKLNAEVNRIVALPDAKSKLEEAGTQLDPMTPEQFATFLRSEIAKYAKLVKAANVSLD